MRGVVTTAAERAVSLADDGVIDVALLLPPATPPTPPQPRALADAERSVITAALAEHRHNVTDAAAALGLSRGTLYRRMARHGL